MKPKKWKPKEFESYYAIHFESMYISEQLDTPGVVGKAGASKLYSVDRHFFKTKKETMIALKKIKKVLRGEL